MRLAALLLAVTAGSAAAQNVGPPDDPDRISYQHALRVLEWTDGAVVAFGWPPLSETSLPLGTREVRVWKGFGFFVPDVVTRIHVAGSAVTGTRGAFWSTSLPDGIPVYERGSVGGRTCRGTAASEDAEVCVFVADTTDWRLALARADAAGLWTLPDETALPGWDEEIIRSDGWSVIVELRHGADYRAYRYWTPQADSGVPEERAVLDVLRALEAQPAE